MSLTKVTYAMIYGSPINVLDYGVSTSASAADNATAFSAALDAGNNLYIPAGTYNITSISIPNKKVIISGDGQGVTILNTTAAVGVDVQQNQSDPDPFASRFSIIQNLSIEAAAGTTGLRINNLGTHLYGIYIKGGAIGIELNCAVLQVWSQVTAIGTTYGIAVRDATFNLGTDAVVWACQFNSISCGATVNGLGNVGLYCNSANVAFMRGCQFNQIDAERTNVGIDLVGSSATENTFINSWVEQAGLWFMREGAGCVNTWINPHYATAGTPILNGAPQYNPVSWVQENGILYPATSGGIEVGRTWERDAVNQYITKGVTVTAKTQSYESSGLYPSNVAYSVYSPLEYKQSYEKSWFYDTVANGAVIDICTIYLTGAGTGFVEIELNDVRGAGGAGGCLKQRRAFKNASGTLVFNTVDTDFNDSYFTLAYTQINTSTFKITATNASPGADRFGFVIRAVSSANEDSTYGLKIV